jgi:predicted nucleic-acid-binding protein
VEFIDSGIFIRHITGDHPAHPFRATRVFDEVARGVREGFSTVTAIAEVVYVLSSVANSYRLSREQIRDTVLPLLLLDHLHLERKHMIAETFDWYTRTPADFVDCYHAVLARELGLTGIVTFDAHFRLFPFGQTRRS